MNLLNLNNAWLSPTGRWVIKDREFDSMKGAWHEELALCILRDIWNVKSRLDAFDKVNQKFNNTAIEELENIGWIRLHGYGGIIPKWIAPQNEITKKQQIEIVDWCNVNNKIYENCFSN